MRSLILGAVLSLALALPAQALCVALPEDADSHYVENSAAHALCLQRELAEAQARLRDRAKLEFELETLRQQMQRQYVPPPIVPIQPLL